MQLAIKTPRNQKSVLRELAALAYRSIPSPQIQLAAKQLTADCTARDDSCELEAIFNAVKHGDARVAPLAKGLRYVADPRRVDFFTAPKRLMELCEQGGCGGDCDDHAALIAALAGAVGFKVGLRAWGPSKRQDGELTHVYAVAMLPKRQPADISAWEVVGLDTTVPESFVGWQPPPGHVITAWVED